MTNATATSETITTATMGSPLSLNASVETSGCWNPCNCEEEGDCNYFVDDFEREGPDIGSKWSEEAGSWELTSDGISTSDTNATVITTTDNPSGNDSYVTTATLIVPPVGTVIRLLTNYFTDQDHWYVEVQALADGSQTLQLFSVIGGSTTAEADVFEVDAEDAGGSVRIRVCWQEEIIEDSVTVQEETVSVDIIEPVGAHYVTVLSTSLNDRRSGVQTAGTLSGYATCSQMTLSHHGSYNPGCLRCGSTCNKCSGSTGPPAFLMELSGAVDTGCGTCDADYNGAFVVEKLRPDSCGWFFLIDDNCSIRASLTLNFSPWFFNQPNGPVYINIILTLGTNSINQGSVHFHGPFTNQPVDCFGLIDVDIPLVFFSGPTFSCDFSNLTCKLTVL